MRRKIIRGKIKSIDSVIDKIDYKSSDGEIDVIKYCIRLENDENEAELEALQRDYLKEFIHEYGFSVAEMKLVNGGLAPVGVMIAYKK